MESSRDRLFRLHKELTESAFATMQVKNNDYAGGDDADLDCFRNFRGSSALGIHPVMGIMLRMQDKMQRMRTFVEKGELKVKDESVRDAVEDSINYLVLMYGLMTEADWEPQENPFGTEPLDYPKATIDWVAEDTGRLEGVTDADGWIPWSGQGTPDVAGDVCVIDRAGDTGTGDVSIWDWDHDGESTDIIAYKVIEEEKPNAPDEWMDFHGGGYSWIGLDRLDLVEVRRRDGSMSGDLVEYLKDWGWDRQFPSPDDIVAYRIIEKYKGEG